MLLIGPKFTHFYSKSWKCSEGFRASASVSLDLAYCLTNLSRGSRYGGVRFFVSTFQEYDTKGKSRHEVQDEHGPSGTERSRA